MVPQEERRDSEGLSRSEFAIQRLSEFKRKFDANTLHPFLELKVGHAEETAPQIAHIVQKAADSASSDGKRLRPGFVYQGFNAAGGTIESKVDQQEIMFAALSNELLHAAMLVHDDWMDRSGLRRGQPTLHRHFGEEVDDERTGDSIAITDGDLLISWAHEVAGNLPFPEDRARKARNLFNNMFTEVCYGQLMDLLGNQLDLENVDEEWVMRVLELKTARYTVEKPLLMGAALAGADDELLAALSEPATALGIAFQMQDDILGMYGIEEQIGKDVDSDLKEGKKTLLVVKAAESLGESKGEEELLRLKRVLGNPRLTEEDYEWTQQVIRETGALDYSRDVAQVLISNAQESLSKLPIAPESKDYLLGISDYLLTRNR